MRLGILKSVLIFIIIWVFYGRNSYIIGDFFYKHCIEQNLFAKNFSHLIKASGNLQQTPAYLQRLLITLQLAIQLCLRIYYNFYYNYITIAIITTTVTIIL